MKLKQTDAGTIIRIISIEHTLKKKRLQGNQLHNNVKIV